MYMNQYLSMDLHLDYFDVFVIGTGTAGKGVAKNCAKAGWKVAIADNREYGGTCPNRGCDPKKVLVGFTEIIDRATKMQGKGITKMPEVNWSDLMTFKETFVDAIPAATEKDLKHNRIVYVNLYKNMFLMNSDRIMTL